MNANIFGLLLTALLAHPAATPIVTGGQAGVDPQDAVVIAGFEERVAEYVALHRKLEGPVAPHQVSDDIRVVRAAMDRLAAGIREARRTARRGDLFTADVTRIFRVRIAKCLPPDELEMIITEREEGDPADIPPLGVNERWPGDLPFYFVPPQLIAALPRLPNELQYRVAGRSLVLWDHHADLIVDVLPDAFPRPTAFHCIAE